MLVGGKSIATTTVDLNRSTHMACSLLEAGRSATAISDPQTLASLPKTFFWPVETKCQQHSKTNDTH
eukprot:8237996-Karenia_brevis.AAC.1